MITDACRISRQYQATRSHLLAAGMGRAALESAVARGDLVRLRRGVYAPGPLPSRGRHLLRDGRPDLSYVAEVRAVLLSLGADAVAAGRTAAVLWAMDMLVEPTAVEVRVPRSRSRVQLKGVTVTRSAAEAAVQLAVLGLDPLPVLSAVDTVLELAATRKEREAVVIADSALRRGLVTVDELWAGLAAQARRPGNARVRRVLALVDPKSGSVLESILRYLLVKNGLHPSSQYVFRDGKRFLYRVDFCFEAERLVVEGDGRRWHDPDDARRTDRHRDNGLARRGWKVLRFTWAEVKDSPAYVLACVRDGLATSAVAA